MPMQLTRLSPRKALNKAYLKVKPTRSEIEHFKRNLIGLLDGLNESESEEHNKNDVGDFLKNTFYHPRFYINTKDRTDLVIHIGPESKSLAGVLIEAKKPSNKAEMIRSDNMNAKAFHELILYYLRERITKLNLEIKHLVATNIYEWYVFDASLFEKTFAQNKTLVKHFTDFEEGRLAGKTTDFFYKEIAEPFMAGLNSEICFTMFDFREYDKPLRNDDKRDDAKLIALYKLLSPEHLLKLPFLNDSNSLDKAFYAELLHIIGLTETKEGNKKLIGRKKEGERNSGSFIENAIIQLDSLDKISRLEKPSQFGKTIQERLFNVALELSITWTNRILFLKLLEAQIIKYHKGDISFAFLNAEKVRNFDDLNSLFFSVLARKSDERNEGVRKIFSNVPYLNSSLFEPTDLEHSCLFISQLKDRTIPIISSTVLKDNIGNKNKGELDTLGYIFKFLEAYDFAGEGAEEIQEENKTLINASVLGLIFEKINGYKDGSFFTPGFITMYMCHETIRKAVVQKFNDAKGWVCKDINQLYDKIEDRNEANNIINSLKICDPAVGSGHFLVSALNEIIAIKSDLNILQDREGRRLKEYRVEVVNDELIVTDEDAELFEYNPWNKESHRIQQTLFHEKQTIIENCLFGVDINPNSAKICRLRLWIELLKNAYYKEPDFTELETLPNIDVNIKCGNSLISRHALDADISQALKKSKWSIDSYRGAIMTYRNAKGKEQKREMERLIGLIKNDFETEVAANDKRLIQLRKLNSDLFNLTNQTILFDKSKKELADWNSKVKELAQKIQKIEAELEEIKTNRIYEDAFEWRFEFPEVLNDDGDFVGFDLVIGNPPYMLLQNLECGEEDYLKQTYKTAKYKGDTFGIFIERGLLLSHELAILDMIVPYTWLSIQQHSQLRNLILSSGLEFIIDLPQKVFESADLDTTIINISKYYKNDEVYIGSSINQRISINGHILKSLCFKNEFNEITLIRDAGEIEILNKIKQSFPLISYFEVSQGYIPYRRSDLIKVFGEKRGNEIVDGRLWHSSSKLSEEFKQEIQGKDLKRYFYSESFQFVKYGKHVAGYVDKRFFINPRILVMEVTRGEKYKITAAFVEKEFYNTPSIINIIHKNNDIGELLCLLALINSRLFTWYHLSVHSKSHAQTSIPKILVREIKNLPIKFFDIKTKEIIIERVKHLIDSKNKEANFDSAAIEKEIDQLVYELYGLTEEERKIVENS